MASVRSPTSTVSSSLVTGSMAAQTQCGERERRSTASASLTSPVLTALSRANLNRVTTPIGPTLSPEPTITVIDPRHPRCGRTLTLIGMTHHAQLGRCCVVWLRPQVERLVPVQAPNFAFGSHHLRPPPLA